MTVSGSPSASFSEFDRKARAKEPLTVVFFGGSLTYGANASDPGTTSWRGLMMDYLHKKYPNTPFNFHDAAIGGTGSDLGMFRLQRDVLSKKPDLVFYDFTMNDGPDATNPEKLAAYEGILRKMIGAGIPVEQEFFTFKFFRAPEAYQLPLYLDHKKLAEAYHTAVADVLVSVGDLVHSGQVPEDKIWPADQAHPYDFGYTLFFNTVRDGLEKAIADGRVCVVPEKPVFSDKFHEVERTVLVDGTLPKGWRRHTAYRTALWYDGLSSRWMADMAVCGGKEKGQQKAITDIDPLKIEFTGTFVGLFGEKSGNGLSFKVKIDGKPVPYEIKSKDGSQFFEAWPNNMSRFAPGYKDAHLFSWIPIATQLATGKHTLEIEPVLDPDNPDGELHIESVCTAGE
ncbi:MAG: SGNH/GDSL hydrolase family protein [Chthoniobacteraceae bacterium]